MNSKKTAEIWIDGAAKPNPGHATIGVVVKNYDMSLTTEISEQIGITTNNIAEYSALIRALSECKQQNVNYITIYSDSQLLVRQIIGRYSVKAPGLIPLFNQSKELLGQFKKWKIKWIPREKNRHADRLTNERKAVYKSFCGV